MTKINGSALVILILTAIIVLLVVVLANNPRQVAHNIVAAPNQVIEWKLATSWPKGFPGLGTAPIFFAEQVNAMSQGQLKITVYGANEIVPALAVFDAVSTGSIEAGHSGAYYWKGKIPASPFFSTIPFGMNAQEMNAWLYQGGGLELWQSLYAPFNLYPLAAGNTGVQMGGWFNKEIKTVDDLKGLKMRIPGLAGEVFNRLGGTAVNIPGGEPYAALKTGVIDATEWVGPYNDIAMGFQEVAQYYYYPGWHEPGTTMELVINKPAFEALPAHLKAIVENAAMATNQFMLNEYTANNSKAFAQLQAQAGLTILPFPQSVLDALQVETNNVINDLIKDDPKAQKIYQSYRDFAESVRRYHQVSETAYLKLR